MRRLGVVALLVAVASAVVAIAATGVGLLLPPASVTGGWALAVRIAAAAAVVAGSAGLLLQRKRLLSDADRRYDPTVAGLVAAATIMAVLALMARLAPVAAGDDPMQEETTASDDVGVEEETEPTAGLPRTSSGGISGGLGMVPAGRDRRVPRAPEDRGDDDADLSVIRQAGGYLLLAAVLAVAVLGVLALKGRIRPDRQREGPPSDGPIAAPDAEEALQASLIDVAYDGPDPRYRITTAYRRLLAALAAAGAPRRPQEAPHEHLRRTLGPLGVRAEPMHSLTELYVVAQFSERPITDEHRAAATRALETGLDSLRATRGEPEVAPTGTTLTDSTLGEARA